MKIQANDDSLVNQSTEDVGPSIIGTLENSTLHYTWFMRTFGPMKKGSLRQSVIALMCTAMGSGMLAYPSNAKTSGLGYAVICMVICALLSRFSMFMLMQCAFKYKIDTYSELVSYAFGPRMKKAYELDVIFYTFGAIVCYQILFVSFLTQVLVYAGLDPSYDTYVQYIAGTVFIVINLPVSMLKDIYSLRYFTHIQIAVIVYILFAIVIDFFKRVSDLEATKIEWFVTDLNLTSTFASTFFGFICHQLIFPIRTELKRASPKRMSKIFNRAIFFETMIYMALMIFGYLTWYGETKNIIIDNYDSIWFVMAKGFMTLIMFFAVPININPSRLTILQFLDKEDSKVAYTTTTLVLQISTAVLAMVYPKVKSAFGLLGGFFGMNMVIVLPGLIYLKLETQFLSKTQGLLTVIALELAACGGFIGAVMSQINA